MSKKQKNTASEILFIAQDAVDNIREIKLASFRVLLSYTAVFGFILGIGRPYIPLYGVIFLIFGMLVIFLCSYWYPRKIRSKRKRLRRAYEGMSKKAQKVHGSVFEIAEDDGGDDLYKLGASIYVFLLILMFILSYCEFDVIRKYLLDGVTHCSQHIIKK